MTNRITRTIVSVVAAAFFAVPVAAQEVSEMEASEISWEPVLDAGAEAITAVIDVNNLSAEQQVLLEEVPVWRQYLPSAGDDWLGEYHELMVDQGILGPDGSLCSPAREGWCYDLFVDINLAAGTQFGSGVPYEHSALLGQPIWFPNFSVPVVRPEPLTDVAAGGESSVASSTVDASADALTNQTEVSDAPQFVDGGRFVSDTNGRFVSLFRQVGQLTDANTAQAEEMKEQARVIGSIESQMSNLARAQSSLAQWLVYFVGLIVITLLTGLAFVLVGHWHRRSQDCRLDDHAKVLTDHADRIGHMKQTQANDKTALDGVRMTAESAACDARDAHDRLNDTAAEALQRPFDAQQLQAQLVRMCDGDQIVIELKGYIPPNSDLPMTTVTINKKETLYNIQGLSRRKGQYDPSNGMGLKKVVDKLHHALLHRQLYQVVPEDQPDQTIAAE